jgi:hypothetical protein
MPGARLDLDVRSPTLFAVALRFARESRWFGWLRRLRNDSSVVFLGLARVAAWLGDGLVEVGRDTRARPVLHLAVEAGLRAMERSRSPDAQRRAQAFQRALISALWSRVRRLAFAWSALPAHWSVQESLPHAARVTLQPAPAGQCGATPPPVFVRAFFGLSSTGPPSSDGRCGGEHDWVDASDGSETVFPDCMISVDGKCWLKDS